MTPPKDNGDWEARFDEKFDYLHSDCSRFPDEDIKAFIRAEKENDRQLLKEKVESMRARTETCGCREFVFGDHDCDYTANAAIDAVLQVIETS